MLDADIQRLLNSADPRDRIAAVQRLQEKPLEDIRGHLDLLLNLLNDEGEYTVYDTDPWGGYTESTESVRQHAYWAIHRLKDTESFFPLLATIREHKGPVSNWLPELLNEIPLPADIVRVRSEVLATAHTVEKHGLDALIDKLFIEGKNLAEQLVMLREKDEVLRDAAYRAISHRKTRRKKGEAEQIVKTLFELLDEPDQYPLQVIFTLWEHASTEQMVYALMDKVIMRSEFDHEVPDVQYGLISHAFTMLGYWIGAPSERAVPRLAHLAEILRRKVNDKEMADLYACILKITQHPPQTVIAGMIAIFGRADVFLKNQIITYMQWARSPAEILKPFWEKHLNDSGEGLVSSQTIGERVRGVLRDWEEFP